MTSLRAPLVREIARLTRVASDPRERKSAVQLSPAPWIEALRHSHDRLQSLVMPLDAAQVEGPSYASEWSIGQVLSHLGSGAEIFGLFLEAGLAGEDPPGQEVFPPIWEVWNTRAAAELPREALRADGALIERIESLDDERRASMRLAMFGMDVDLTMLTRMRLSEHAVHSWDIAVALDPAATLAPDAVDLMVDILDTFMARMGKPGGKPLDVQVSTTSPERHFVLTADDKVTLTESAGEESRPALRLPAEALIRLVYGRLDPAHTPAVQAEGVDLDDLRRMFPGF